MHGPKTEAPPILPSGNLDAAKGREGEVSKPVNHRKDEQ